MLPGVAGLFAVLVVARLTMRGADEQLYRRIITWSVISFAVHVLIGVAILSSSGAVNFFGPDAVQYHLGAADIVGNWAGHNPFPLLPSGKEGFFYLLAGLYYVVGAHPIAGVIVNAALSAATIPIMTDLTRRLAGVRAAYIVPILLVILPSSLVWPSQLLREAGVVFLLALAAYSAVRLTARTEPSQVFLLAASLALLLTFRSNVAVVLAVGLIIGVIVGRRRVAAGFGSSLGAASILGVLVFSLGIGYSGYRFASSADFKTASDTRTELSATANSGVGGETDISTPSKAAAYLPVTLVQFAAGPFPWQAASARQLPGVAEAASLWILFPSLLRGFRLARRQSSRRVFVLVLPALMLAAMLSLVIGNFGAIIRERLQVVILLIPFIALGWVTRHELIGLNPSAEVDLENLQAATP